jgi:hypothetical protein
MIALRILLGILKGALVGGGLGAGLWALDPDGQTLAFLRWPVYGLVGFLTGAVCGKPPWARGSAWVASILKAVFGFGLAVGLYFLADWLFGLFPFQVLGRSPTMWPFAFGAVLGVIYGVWVELDDGGKADEEKDSRKLREKPEAEKLQGKDEAPALPPADDEG